MAEPLGKKDLDLIAKLEEKVKQGDKLTFSESKELTAIVLAHKDASEQPDYKPDHNQYSGLSSAQNLLKNDGFLSSSEVDAARETFRKVLESEPGSREHINAIVKLEKGNPDARTLNREYFKAQHEAEDAIKDLKENGVTYKYTAEKHTFFGGITGHNDEVDKRNEAKREAAANKAFEKKTTELLEQFTEARLPATPELMKTDKTLEATLKKLGQTELIEDTKAEGSMGTSAPSGQKPSQESEITK